MATLFLDCLMRATLVAGGTAGVLWAMRIKTAATRHAAWTAVVIAMLLLPIWSMAGLRLPVRILQPASAAVVATPDASADQAPIVSEPNEAAISSVSASAPRRFDALDTLFAVYLLVAGVLLARLATGTVLALRLRRGAVVQSGISTSDRCATPITIGWLRPVAVLPASWSQWPDAQLRAVLTHEGEHVRRRDPLVQWLALLNRAVFWFHPIAWWLERRLSALAEEACDAAVLAAGCSPEDYSGYLLDLARSVAGQHHRVHIGMAMVGDGLGARLRQILDGGPTSQISRGRIVFTIVLCALSSAICAGGTLSPRASVQAPQTTGPQTFDVASIRPCDLSTVPAKAGSGPTHIDSSHHRLFLECITVESLVRLAYARNGHFVLNDQDTGREIRGGPDWIHSSRYTIEATTASDPDESTMSGTMLRALLESRFLLRTHSDVEQVSKYAVQVAKSGLKIKPIAAGDCTNDDADAPIGGKAGGKLPCGMVRSQHRGATRIWDLTGASLKELVDVLETDREVVDQTGVTGRFMIHLEYAREDASADERARDEAAGHPPVSIPAALEQQLGLQFVSIKGPHTYFVIDRIERPTPNAPIILTPPRAGGARK